MILLFVGCDPKGQDVDSDDKIILLERLSQLDLKSNSEGLHHLTDSLLNLSFSIDSLFLQKVNYYKAKAYFSEHNTHEAVSIFKIVLPYFSVNKVRDYKIKSKLYLAMCYADLGEQTKANMMGLEAKNDALKYKYSDLYSASLESLSYLSYKNKDFDRALDYMKEAEEHYKSIGDDSKLSVVLNNIGILYRNLGQLNEAAKYQEESLIINLRTKDMIGVSKSYTNLGLIAEDKGLMGLAIENYQKAIKINNDNNLVNPNPILNVANIYSSLGQHHLSTQFYEDALDILKRKEDLQELKGVYEKLLSIAMILNDVFRIEKYATLLENLENSIELKEQQERNIMLRQQENLMEEKLYLEQKQINNSITQFTLFVVLICLLMVIFFFIQRFKSLRIENERNAISLELKLLRSQMNPHFIFNTLTSIQNQMLSNDPVSTAQSISRFSKLIRQNFEFTSKNEITLAEDIDALENYLSTQKMRYDDKFDFSIDIDTSLNSFKLLVPPMLLQPFVENAIEHGFKNISYKGVIEVSIVQLNSRLMQFSITDNGIGYKPKDDNQLHAIDIIKKRLQLNETGEQSSFQIMSLGKNKGTQVKFNLFIKSNENYTA